jgi:signal transduction histidine kinase
MQILRNKLLKTEDFTLISDQEKIFSILTNLVKNAIKYCDKGNIEIGVSKNSNFLEIYVKDNGPGINTEQQRIIFERFLRGSQSLTSHHEGAGLGLSISKAYVELLGGEIWLKSELGVGSTFFFTLPTENNTNS